MKKTKGKAGSFSKYLLLLESAAVLYATWKGFSLAELAIEKGYLGSLAWITSATTAAWSAYGASAAFYYNKAKAENTVGGIVYTLACGGVDCDDRRSEG